MLSCRKTNDFVNRKGIKMKKTILAILSATLILSVVTPAQAQDQRVLAIIDTAINSNNFPSIIHEVCITTVKSSDPKQNMSCPNGELFMEGKGAASAIWPTSVSNGTYHGDAMVKSALTVNPNTKIVFIRYHDINSNGNSLAKPEALVSAIEWVAKNASKHSIDAVSISQSGVSTNITTKERTLHSACSNASAISSVAQLSLNNVPVFAATGNDGLPNLVGFPACIPGVIGVGASTANNELHTSTNSGPGLDMIAIGQADITRYNGQRTTSMGTSVATAIASSSYVNKNTSKTFQEYLNSLAKVSVAQLINKQWVNKGVYSRN